MKFFNLHTCHVTNRTPKQLKLKAQGLPIILEGGQQVTLDVNSEERAALVADKRLAVKTLRQA